MNDSNMPAKRAPQTPAQLPLSSESLRQELLLAAGFDKARQIALVRKALESAEQDLEADKTLIATNFGKITDVMRVPDHQARAKAREQILDALLSTKRDSGTIDKSKIEIPLAPWMQGLSVTVGTQPTPPKTIDVTPHPEATP